MNLPKVLRPEIEIEYKGTIGFLRAMCAIVEVGVKRAKFDITFMGETVETWRPLVIPKYTVRKVKD